MLITVGVLSIVVLTVATGYFVAQEFAHVTADRGRLRVMAEASDTVGFTTVFRPFLTALNGLANACLRAVGVQPQDELAQVHSPEQLHLLLAQSREHGTIPATEHDLLTAMLRVQSATIGQVMVPAAPMVTTEVGATARQVEQRSMTTGRSRLIVVDHTAEVVGVVHAREATKATSYPDRGDRRGSDERPAVPTS